MKSEEIDCKIGTKEEATWTQIKESIEKRIQENKIITEMDEHALKFVEQKLETFK